MAGRKGQRGNIAIMTMLLMPAVIGLHAGAVDLVRATMLRAQLQRALDAAALATASLTSTSDAQETARDFVFANLSNAEAFGSLTLNITPQSNLRGKLVEITATASVDTLFLGLFGVETFDLDVVSSGSHDWQQIEVALVLDVSGSMASGNKIGKLRDAAEEFVDEMLPEGMEEITTVSVIPFGTHVNVGDTFRPFIDPSEIDSGKDNNYGDGHRWLGCLDIPAGQYTNTVLEEDSLRPLPEFRDYRLCPNANNEAVFQMNDRNDLITIVRDLTNESSFAGGTSIDEGTFFGLMALHPGMRGRFGGAFSATRPTDYNSDVLKALIIMSDGDMNKWYRPAWCWHYSWGCVEVPVTTSQAETNMLAMCDEAARNNILVFTVGFGISEGSRADEVLSDCVSVAANYFLVDDTDIGAAFMAIAANINSVRLVM